MRKTVLPCRNLCLTVWKAPQYAPVNASRLYQIRISHIPARNMLLKPKFFPFSSTPFIRYFKSASRFLVVFHTEPVGLSASKEDPPRRQMIVSAIIPARNHAHTYGVYYITISSYRQYIVHISIKNCFHICNNLPVAQSMHICP